MTARRATQSENRPVKLTKEQILLPDVEITVPLSTWEALPERIREMFHWYAENGAHNGGTPLPVERRGADGVPEKGVRFTGIPGYRWAEMVGAMQRCTL